ncbi:hypothetical protein [Kutzneria sp. 744]|uniref:hypothetical protein n=1 Tax=Kutzneria sp. (strain 744) TaxID=345341 RepID=UPI0003EED0FA|nr:hypothetical protein [Kutzneria sp. 744]EWM19793.1 LigA protein [Kutzneria sp. 744]
MTLRTELDRYYDRLLAAQRHSTVVDLLGDIRFGGDAVARDVARLAAVADQALPAIIGQLSAAAERLGLIEHVLANPSQTAGDELFRNGSYALAEGWLQDAVTDLERAVAQFRYNPAWWFNLAVARERAGAGAGAAEAFAQCAQYGARQAPVMAATAVLIAAGLYRRLHEVERSAEVLMRYIEPLAACAELHLALAVHHGRTDHLMTAFALAPGLVVDARAAGLSDVTETVAAAVCARPNSPVDRLSALNDVITQLVQAIQDADLPPGPDVGPHPPLPATGGDALLLAQAGLSMAAERAHRLIEHVQEALAAQQAAVESSRITLGAAAQHVQLLARPFAEVRFYVLAVMEAMQAYGGGSSAHVLSLTAHDFTYEREQILALVTEQHTLWFQFDASADVVHWEVFLRVAPDTPGARARQAYANTVRGVQPERGVFLQLNHPDQLAAPPVGEDAQAAIRAAVAADLAAQRARMATAAGLVDQAESRLDEALQRQARLQDRLASQADALREAIRASAAEPQRIIPFGSDAYLQLGA